MSAMPSDLGSVHVRETAEELVVEVAVPVEVDLARLSARRVGSGLEIRLPRVRRHHHVASFHPEATGV
jgi:hypothetical protein